VTDINNTFSPEIWALLNPSAVYAHPQDVLNDTDLTAPEKRAILSAWASDACSVDSCPAMRKIPGAEKAVTFDEVLDALKSLDDDPPSRWSGKHTRLRSQRHGPDPNSGGTAVM